MAFDSVALSPATYLRISKDDEETGLGVERQRKATEMLVRQRNWPVGEVYPENDTSAFSGNDRPVYRRMLEDIAAGKHDAIVVYNTSRLTRTPRDLEDLIDLHKKTGFLLITTEGDIDLGTPQGVAMARMLGAVNANYSETNQKALKDKHAELAAAGKVAGRQRVYGYDAVRVEDDTLKGWHYKRVINEHEADIIRETAAEIIEVGEKYNLTERCDKLNADGERTVEGNLFIVQSMRKIMISWRIAGIRDTGDVPQGEGGEWVDGQLVNHTADWDPIISEDDLKTVRGILMNPSRRTYTGAGRKYLLSNLLVCGRCGGLMQFKTSTKKATEKKPAARWDSYACKLCGSGIGMEVADTTVIDAVARMLALPSSAMQAFVDAEPEAIKELRSKRIEVRSEIDKVHEMGLRADTAGPMLKRLDAELDALDAEITTYLHRDAVRTLLGSLRPLRNAERRVDPLDLEEPQEDGPVQGTIKNRQAVRDMFATMDLARRRAVVTALMHVEIAPWTVGKTKREDAIARMQITPLDPMTGQILNDDSLLSTS